MEAVGESKCVVCCKSFGSENSLRMHVLRVHNSKVSRKGVKCDVCRKCFPNTRQLERHIEEAEWSGTSQGAMSPL